MLLTLFRDSASSHLKGLSHSESRLTSIRKALSKRQDQDGRSTQKKYISPELASIPEGLDRLAYALGEFLAVRSPGSLIYCTTHTHCCSSGSTKSPSLLRKT